MPRPNSGRARDYRSRREPSSSKQQDVECWTSASKLPARLLMCGHIVPLALAKSYGTNVSCPTCDKPSPVQSGPHFVRDYVPTQALLWEAACNNMPISSQQDLSGHIKFEQMLAHMSGGAQTLDLHEQLLRPQRIPQPPDSFLVWRATPAGCTVQQGTIALPKDGILLLAGHGAHFNGTTFSGGVVMLAGPAFSGTFQQCLFEECTLYAVHGASARLRRCRFQQATPAVVASGAATVAHITSCLFHSCYTGLVADRGAAVVLQASAVINSTMAVIATDAGTHAEVEQMTAQIGRGANTLLGAVLAGQGASAHVCRCDFSSSSFGVYGNGRGTAFEVHQTSIQQYARGIVAEGRARAALRALDAYTSEAPTPGRYYRQGGQINTNACAVNVGGSCIPGGLIQMHRCRVRSSSGVQGCDGGRLEAVLCDMACTSWAVLVSDPKTAAHLRFTRAGCPNPVCVVQSEGARLRIEGCQVDGAGGACAVAAAGTLTIADSVLDGGRVPEMRGTVAAGPGRLALLRCRVQSAGVGLRLDAVEARVVDTEFVHCDSQGRSDPRGDRMHPVAVYNCSPRLTMVGGALRGHVHGVLCVPMQPHPTMRVRLDGVRFDGCAQAVECSGAAVVEVSRCRFVGCRSDAATRIRDVSGHGRVNYSVYPGGVSLDGVDSATVQDCVFKGQWLAVSAGGKAPVHVRSCQLDCDPQRDRPFVVVRTGAVVEDCQVAGAASGVHVDGGASAVIRRCRFGPNCEVGVRLLDRAVAQVLDCSVLRADIGLGVGAHGQLTIQDCTCADVGMGIAMNGQGATFSGKRLTVMRADKGVVAGCEVGSRAVLKLVDSKLVGDGGDESFGVCVAVDDAMVPGGSVDASLLRCEVERFGTAVSMKGASRVKVRGSSVRNCRMGLAIGQHRIELLRGCPYCNRSGESGYAHAIREVVRAAGQPVAAARCPHEGAVTRAVVEDVTIEQCWITGLDVTIAGHVTAKRLRLIGCHLTLTWAAEQSRFEDCIISDRNKALVRCERVPGRIESGGLDSIPGLSVAA